MSAYHVLLHFGCRTRAIKNKPKTNAIISIEQLFEMLGRYNATIRENREYIRDLDNELENLSDFFDMLRQSPEGRGILLGNTYSSVLKLKRDSPELLISGTDSCNNLGTNSPIDLPSVEMPCTPASRTD